MVPSFAIYTYQARNRRDVLELFESGMLTGHIDPVEGTADLENVEQYYLRRTCDHFWVAEAEGRLIGMVALVQDEQRIAHIRRLRVLPNWQQTNLAYHLVKTTLAHASEHDALKIVLHTPVDQTRAMGLLGHLGFSFAGRKELRGRCLLEFYRDLYHTSVSDPDAAVKCWRLT